MPPNCSTYIAEEGYRESKKVEKHCLKYSVVNKKAGFRNCQYNRISIGKSERKAIMTLLTWNLFLDPNEETSKKMSKPISKIGASK